MKNALTLSIISIFLSAAALAAATTPADEANHPCHAIKKACEAGGYLPGEHKKNGKGLWHDCFHPILKGASVAGVTVDAATVAACKAKKATFKAEHEQH